MSKLLKGCDAWLEGMVGLPENNNRKAIANATLAVLCDEGKAASRVVKADVLVVDDGQGEFQVHLASELTWCGEELGHLKTVNCLQVMLDFGLGIQRVRLACLTDVANGGVDSLVLQPQPSTLVKVKELKDAVA